MKHKKIVRSKNRKPTKPSLAGSFRSVVRRGFGILVVSEMMWPVIVAGSAIALFVVLPPSRLDSVPTGPVGKIGDVFSRVAIALNIQEAQPTEAESTDDVVTAPSGKKSAASGEHSGQTASAGSSTFVTLPPGSALPSDSDCAARVVARPEVRPANTAYNQTKGVGGNTEFPRVTGNFTGTTDEILQWAACKWGIDENIAKAQAVKESWWFHRTMGDFAADPALCWPPNNTLGADPAHPGQCPESVGILQVRYEYHKSGLAAGTYSPYYSTAYNVDYTYAVWRDCYEGNMTWLNSVEKGAVYTAGDVWGCIGEWFSGRWYTPGTLPYINAVKSYMEQRMWENPDFLAAT